MSNPIPDEEEDAESTTTTTSTTTNSSSINPNAEENGRPIYSTENPLMQPPPQIQSLMSSESQPQNNTPTEEPSRSNPQENTPQQETITATSINPEVAQQQQLQQMQATQQKQKAELNVIDATIQGLYLQIIAHQHNKINILSGNTNAQQL